MGSGKRILRAIKKHGVENFRKDYLEILDSEEKMNLAERIYVVLDKEMSYNLCPGGQGGWGYINENGLSPFKDPDRQRTFSPFGSPEFIRKNKEACSIGTRARNKKYGKPSEFCFDGRKHSQETRRRMSVSHQGKHEDSKNSQFGTCWINNGMITKKVPNTEITDWLSKGWSKGRQLIGM